MKQIGTALLSNPAVSASCNYTSRHVGHCRE
ncbi:hypothetical protein M2283_009874 [Streptomyces pseudovenezuelae]|uniref:Uncharacterized protein n=1 Tax=Streptomyces pseudovenezuelae TaxID=67350 RepID=A0ABT6M1Y3_9ACTN|nr:hypothetical protein [Streptomyces pseudovenezuelae]